MTKSKPTPKPKLTKQEEQKAVFDRFMAGHMVSLQEARSKVKLFWYCRTPEGWRYLPDGAEVRTQFTQGRLMIRERVMGKRVYTPVQDAQNLSKELEDARTRAMRPSRSSTPAEEAGSLSVAIAEYIADRNAHNKLEAAENARVVLNEFRELLPTVKTVRGISKEHLTQFCMKLREKELSDRTISNKYERLRAFLKFAGHDVKLSKDDRPRYESKLPTVYTRAETEALLKHSDDYMRVALRALIHSKPSSISLSMLSSNDSDSVAYANQIYDVLHAEDSKIDYKISLVAGQKGIYVLVEDQKAPSFEYAQQFVNQLVSIGLPVKGFTKGNLGPNGN